MVASTTQIDTLKKFIYQEEISLNAAKQIYDNLGKSIPQMEESLNADKNRLAEMEKNI